MTALDKKRLGQFFKEINGVLDSVDIPEKSVLLDNVTERDHITNHINHTNHDNAHTNTHDNSTPTMPHEVEAEKRNNFRP
jgi:hypothetical protein